MTLKPHLRLLTVALGLTIATCPAHAQFGALLGNILGAASSLAGATPTAATPPVVGGNAPAAAAAAAGIAAAVGAVDGAPTAAPAVAATLAAADPAQIAAALQAAPVLLDGAGAVKGTLDQLRGKRFYISEYRVLFEQSGSISANTRAAYLGGTNYGATRMTVRYAAPAYDVATLQAVTDKAYADFQARLEAAGLKPESADKIAAEFGQIYENTVEASRPGAPLIEEASFGHGKRKYMVMSPTGMKLHPRGLAGLGAGNISNRIAYSKAGVEAIAVVVAVHIAAQETSGNASSLFRSGSSANASAALEIAQGPNMVLLQGHAASNLLRLEAPLAVPGQFASFRETGGYDTRKDAAMVGLTVLGNLMGQAVNQSKSVEMTVDIDPAAMVALAFKGLATVNQGIVAQIK